MPAIDPIFITVADAAEALSLSRWQVYQLLDKQAIESRYQGTKRLVSVASLREYAEGLPTERPADDDEAVTA